MNNFSGLFSTVGSGNLERCFAHFEERVTNAMNDELSKPFTSEEVNFALYQMGPLKAPGPDGLSAGFFQNHWEIVRNEVSQTILDTLNNGFLPPFLNMTRIALIPKIKKPVVCYRI